MRVCMRVCVCVYACVHVCVCVCPRDHVRTSSPLPVLPPCRSVALWSLAKKKPVQYRSHAVLPTPMTPPPRGWGHAYRRTGSQQHLTATTQHCCAVWEIKVWYTVSFLPLPYPSPSPLTPPLPSFLDPASIHHLPGVSRCS